MPTTTPWQGLPIPLGTDNPGDLDTFFNDLAVAVEKKLVQVYTDVTDRDTKVTAPANGMLTYLSTPAELYLRTGGAWVRIYPSSQPAITTSTSVPANTEGSDGDIHFVV